MKAYLLILIHLALAKIPKDFGFGVSTAAYQIEGAWLADGKSLSNWDNYVHSGMVTDNSTGDVADNSYYKYSEDIALMKEYGIKHYRLSISWTRIVPHGTKGSKVNLAAIEHYRAQLTALIEAGITPYVTLCHNVIPANLYIKGIGYVDPDFSNDFAYYADVCFKHFGDLVKYWFTFNEPWCQAVFDEFEPEEIDTKPYNITHSILLAHAKAVKLYRDNYKQDQRGKIGIVLNSEVYYPKDSSKLADKEAAERGIAFQFDWYAEPLFTGDYPRLMKNIVKERLPTFTEAEKKMLIGSIDFFAFNSYFPVMAESENINTVSGFFRDRNAKLSNNASWNVTDMGWGIYPQGFYDILLYAHNKWLHDTNIEVFIAESGIAVNEANITAALNDWQRIEYLQTYIAAMARAIDEGVNVTRFFVWSLLDNFEWGSGLTKKFGLARVDYANDQKRIPKSSLKWYSQLIKSLG